MGWALVGGAWFLGQNTLAGHGATPPTERYEIDVESANRPIGDFVIATVNGEPIYHSEFIIAVQSLPGAAQPITSRPAGKRVMLEELVKLKVLKQEAIRNGWTREPNIAAEIATALDGMVASVALDRLVNEEPDDLESFYNRYRNEFRGTRTRQILIAYRGGLIMPRGGGKAAREAEAIKRADEIVGRLRSGEDFAAVARAESDDEPTASRGGDLGLVRPGQLGSVLDSTVELLEIDEISEPIKSAYGIHVFQVTGRETSTYDEVRGSLQRQGASLKARIVVNALKTAAKVEIQNEEFFEGIVP